MTAKEGRERGRVRENDVGGGEWFEGEIKCVRGVKEEWVDM